jgi:hypothetical protein
MNCAYLKVVGTTTLYTGPRMFVANTGQCTTSEGIELVFPNRGNNVQYGGSYAGMTNVASTPDCATGNNGDVTVYAAGNTNNGSSAAGGGTSTSTSGGNTPFPNTTTTGLSAGTTSSSANASPTGATGSCTQGAILCSSDGNSWSVCVNNAYIALGSVSSGTKCLNGAIVCANSNTTPNNSTPRHARSL